LFEKNWKPRFIYFKIWNLKLQLTVTNSQQKMKLASLIFLAFNVQLISGLGFLSPFHIQPQYLQVANPYGIYSDNNTNNRLIYSNCDKINQ